jgi:glucose 1-dehydrogenase
MSLEGKVAIVTGGNSGIGKSIVLALGAVGASVCVDYVVHQDIAEDEREQVRAMEDLIIAVKADVSKVDEVQMLVDETVKAFGHLDILVNNAGIETRTSVLDTTEAQYDRVLDINLKGAFLARSSRPNR